MQEQAEQLARAVRLFKLDGAPSAAQAAATRQKRPALSAR
jgi:hypothetical protein